MNKFSIILFSILLTISVNCYANGPLKVKRQAKGFIVTKEIEGRDILLAYSNTGNFDEAINCDSTFRTLMVVFGKQEQLKSPLLLSGSLPDYISPLCTDLWAQKEPYNAMTPMIDSTHCDVGCTALSMAQVMYHYKYPNNGTGFHSYTDSLGCKQTLTANFSEHIYKWDYMLDNYQNVDYSERQVNSIAQFLSDCGIAVDMKYNTYSSGAQTIKQSIALTGYFGYDKGIRMIYRDFYSKNDLHTLIKTELAKGHPVLCSGFGIDGGGHAFVIDGYDSNELFHINWGWGGWCNGYYNIDYMTANQPEWGLFPNRQENGANLLQIYTLGIQPLTTAVNTKETHEFAFSHINYISTTDEGIKVAIYNLGNVGWNEYKGRVVLALKKVEEENPTCIVYDYNHEFALEELEDTTYTDTLTISIPSDLDDGTYQLLPMFDDNGEWKEARTSRGTPNYLYIEKKNENVKCKEAQEAVGHLVLTDFQFPDTIVRRKTTEFSVTITNDSEDEYCGRTYIVFENDDVSKGYQILAGIGQYLEPGETHTIDFKNAKMNIGKSQANIRVIYDVDLFTDSICMFDEIKKVTVVDTPTGIDEIETEKGKEVYDIAGRKIKTVLPNKIIITNDGKKRRV